MVRGMGSKGLIAIIEMLTHQVPAIAGTFLTKAATIVAPFVFWLGRKARSSFPPNSRRGAIVVPRSMPFLRFVEIKRADGFGFYGRPKNMRS